MVENGKRVEEEGGEKGNVFGVVIKTMIGARFGPK